MMAKLFGIRVDKKVKKLNVKPGGNKTVFAERLGGYPGLTLTAKQISEYIPRCKTFIEPFAGLGRISKLVLADDFILNDVSEFAFQYLKGHFKNAMILNHDYSEIIKCFDSVDSYFFFDPPWDNTIYTANPLTEITKPVIDIYNDLKKILPSIRGNWMIAGAIDGPLLKWSKEKYFHKEIKSRFKRIFGKNARTYLVSNKPFVNYWQKKL